MTAKRTSLRVGLAAALFTSGVLCLMVFAQRPERKPVINFLASAKPIHLDRERIQTFAVKSGGQLSEETANRLAERLLSYSKTSLPRQREPNEKIEGRILFQSSKDPSASLRIDLQSGDFMLNAGWAAYKGEQETARLPEEEEAEKLAAEHLRKLDLSPPSTELVVAHVGGINMGVHRSDGSTSLYRKLRVVRYERTLAGLPVLGDSRMIVRLGEGGRLMGLIRRWSPVEGRRVSPAELLPDDAIERSIRERLLAEAGAATNIVVKFTDLVLYDHGNGVIEPAIHVVGDMHYEVKVVSGPTVGEIRRLDVPYDTFIPVLKSYKGHYPFMRNPDAKKYIKTDPSAVLKEREEPQPESTAGEKSP